jgi:hypothetical protein
MVTHVTGVERFRSACDDHARPSTHWHDARPLGGYHWSALGRLDSFPPMEAMVKYLEAMDHLRKTPRPARVSWNLASR